ncbi:MAG TPA: ATP synthase subunit I [Bryobacteraceae bacterium]|nr:ATP synthase subunit I [Bryobacteraceae bacterium]
MDPEQLFVGRAIRRIQLMIVFLSAAGALVTIVYGGWRWGFGFILGAAAGYLNFRWLKKLVDSLGEAAHGKPPRARVAIFLGLRYLLLAAGGYVILNFSTLSLAAALIGLFVPAAAVVLEILFELIYAGT